MKTRNILIGNIPLTDQSSSADPFWKIRACGVAVVKMLIEFTYPDRPPLLLDQLITEGLALNAYMDNVGWRHAGLVELAGRHGLTLRYQKEFYKTTDEKAAGAKFIENNIRDGKPVMASVHRDFKVENEGHLVIVSGLSEESDQIISYHIQDPDGRTRGNHYVVSKHDFLNAWRGGVLWLKDM